MKKILFSIIILLVSFISAIYFGVYNVSRDNLSNAENNLANIVYSTNDLLFSEWNGEANYYTSVGNDPTIIINSDINTYVHTVSVHGSIKFAENDTVQIFYTDEPGEDFSEEKSVIVVPELRNTDVYFSIDKDVCRLRIDLFSDAGKNIRLTSIEINPTNLHFDASLIISSFSMTCCAIGLIYILFFRFTQIKASLSGLKKFRYLLQNLVVRDIKTKYRRSILGILWSVLNPLLMMLVLTAVFANIYKFDVKDFPVYYLTGSIIFNFVSEATSFSLTSIITASGLIKKVYIPKYIFPLEKCLFSFVNTLFSLVAVVIVFLILGITPTWTMILFPVPLIYTLIFSLGLGLILAALNVFFRDIGHLWGVWITAWMYLTPIIYPLSILPNWMVEVIKFNPLYYYVEYFRSIMLRGTVPSLHDNLVCISLSCVTLAVGLIVFKKKQDKFILYI